MRRKAGGCAGRSYDHICVGPSSPSPSLRAGAPPRPASFGLNLTSKSCSCRFASAFAARAKTAIRPMSCRCWTGSFIPWRMRRERATGPSGPRSSARHGAPVWPSGTTCTFCSRRTGRRPRNCMWRDSSIRQRSPKIPMSTCTTWSTVGTRADSDFSGELPRHVLTFKAHLARLPLVPVREDTEQQIRPGGGIVGSLDDERRSPRRIERFTAVGLPLCEVEALFVPLQHRVAAHHALLVATLVWAPPMRALMLPLADRGRAGVKSDPFVDIGVLGLRTLGIRFFVQLLADGAEVIEEHRSRIPRDGVAHDHGRGPAYSCTRRERRRCDRRSDPS